MDYIVVIVKKRKTVKSSSSELSIWDKKREETQISFSRKKDSNYVLILIQLVAERETFIYYSSLMVSRFRKKRR